MWRECWGSILLNLLITPFPFIALVILSLKWWPKFSFSLDKFLSAFENLHKKRISLKKTYGWDDLITFLKKITYWPCLFKSGLNDILHWCAPGIFCKSLFNSYAVFLASWIMGKSDVSSANNLTEDMISFGRSLI